MGVVLAGCSGLKKTVRAPSQPLSVTSVFVYPVRVLGGAEPSWRLEELHARGLGVAVREAGDALAFYGPTEFKVLRPESDDAWVATTALPVLVSAGSRADQGLVIRPVLERRVNSSTNEASTLSGRAAGGASNEVTTWLGRVEVMHPSTKEVLLEAEGSVVVDPFAEPTAEAEFDPAPAVTALLESLIRTAAAVSAKHAAARPVAPEPPVTLALTPQTALQAQKPIEGAAVEPPVTDALQLELLSLNVARVLNPGLSEAQATKLAAKAPGLAVLTSGTGKLQPGDLVETIDGAPALPHVWARVRFKGAPAELHVRRADGTASDVVFP
ncbi:MAG: hypothetical protein JNG84_07295 [Archangium sp.]|nr:hypothetical protein [Archangium sp.]